MRVPVFEDVEDETEEEKPEEEENEEDKVSKNLPVNSIQPSDR